jgi:hypothetical protein
VPEIIAAADAVTAAGAGLPVAALWAAAIALVRVDYEAAHAGGLELAVVVHAGRPCVYLSLIPEGRYEYRRPSPAAIRPACATRKIFSMTFRSGQLRRVTWHRVNGERREGTADGTGPSRGTAAGTGRLGGPPPGHGAAVPAQLVSAGGRPSWLRMTPTASSTGPLAAASCRR